MFNMFVCLIIYYCYCCCHFSILSACFHLYRFINDLHAHKTTTTTTNYKKNNKAHAVDGYNKCMRVQICALNFLFFFTEIQVYMRKLSGFSDLDVWFSDYLILVLIGFIINNREEDLNMVFVLVSNLLDFD